MQRSSNNALPNQLEETPQEQHGMALKIWQQLVITIGSPSIPKTLEGKKQFINEKLISPIEEIYSWIKKAVDNGHKEAAADYGYVLYFHTVIKFIAGCIDKLPSWPQFRREYNDTFKKIIFWLDQPKISDYKQLALAQALASDEAKDSARSFSIVKNLAEKNNYVTLEFPYLIVLAREHQYFIEPAKKALVEGGKGNHPLHCYVYQLLTFPEIVNELKQYNNGAGQKYVEELLEREQKQEPLKDIFNPNLPPPIEAQNERAEIIKEIREMAVLLSVPLDVKCRVLSGIRFFDVEEKKTDELQPEERFEIW